MVHINYNTEKNGIEISFDQKPAVNVIVALKENGFRWYQKRGFWYAKNTEETNAFTNNLFKQLSEDLPCGAGTFSFKNSTQQKEKYSLWEMTQIDAIGNNFEKYRIYDVTEIAGIVRKHLRSRFPMCKWSVRKTGYNSMNVTIVSSPFKKDSDALKAIVHYAFMFAESYNYDNSDSMTDYFDVNFYGVYENSIVDYDYQQREATEEEKEILEAFTIDKEAYEKEKAKREEKEFQAYLAAQKIREEENRKAEERRKINCEKIEKSAVIKEVDYFVINSKNPNDRKNDNLANYCVDENSTNEICKVAREVHLTKETYDLLAGQLMDDFSFFAGMGGSSTEDYRVNSMIDYDYMTDDEKKTVVWYNNKCVAVFCDGKMMYIVDPQGFNYARYVYLFYEDPVIADDYPGANRECVDLDLYKQKVETIEDVSVSVIMDNDILKTWHSEDFPVYKKAMISWIKDHNFDFSIHVIRQVDNDTLKSALYKVYMEVDSIQDQFNNAGFSNGQNITLIRIGDFGGLSISNLKYVSHECGDYCGNNAVKLNVKRMDKRGVFYTWLYREVLIFDGHLKVPDDLLWETIVSDSGLVCRKTKYLSCDRAMYDAVLKYFAEKGIAPLVNTYKSCFNK